MVSHALAFEQYWDSQQPMRVCAPNLVVMSFSPFRHTRRRLMSYAPGRSPGSRFSALSRLPCQIDKWHFGSGLPLTVAGAASALGHALTEFPISSWQANLHIRTPSDRNVALCHLTRKIDLRRYRPCKRAAVGIVSQLSASTPNDSSYKDGPHP